MSFIKNIFSVFSTQIVEKIIRQFNSIILARFIGPSALGIYSLFLTLAQNFFIIFEFGLGSAGIFHIRRGLNKEKKIIENVVLFSIFSGTIITLIIFFTRKFISKILIDDNPLFIAMLSAIIPIIMVSSIFSILARGLKRFDIYNYFILIKPFVFLILIFFTLIIFKGDLFYALLSQVISIFIAGLWILVKIYRLYPFKFNFHKEIFLQNIRYGFKQHILKISLMLLSSIQIYILKYFTDSEIIGQYSIVLSIIALVAFFKTSVSFVLTPTVSELKDNEIHKLISKACKYTFLISIVSSIVIAFLGSIYVEILYGENYKYASKVFVWFLPGIIFHSTCVILHRDFTNRESPIQSIPIFAYSIGVILISILTFLFLKYMIMNPLRSVGLAYSFSHLIVLLILSHIFTKQSKISYKELYVLSVSDLMVIKQRLKNFLNKKT